MDERDEQERSVAVDQIFQKVGRLEAPDFLEARVFAQWRGRQEASARIWKRLALVSSALGFGAVGVLIGVICWTPDFRAFVDQPFAVRIELKKLPTDQIKLVKIELPQGVEFYVEKYPQIREQHSLSLRWTKEMNRSVLPIVLRGAEQGKKIIRVRFLDEDNNVIAERALSVNLSQKGSHS